MDSKEIKALLKQARDAIKDKEYKTALKHCKRVLKADQSNYNAWVFVGVAAQEIDQPEQSVAAFKRAIEVCPDQHLAWQGLSNFYEKQEKCENQDDVIEVYTKLIELFNSDKDKQLEVLAKLIKLAKSTGNKEKYVNALQLQSKIIEGDPEKEYYTWKAIFEELHEDKNLNPYLENLLQTACLKIIKYPSFLESECQRIFKIYILPLYQNGKKEKAINLSNEIRSKYPDSASCVEFLCMIILDEFASKGCTLNDLDDVAKKLKLINDSSGLFNLIQGLCSLSSGNYLQTIKELKKGLEKMPSCLEAWLILTSVQLRLHRYQDAESSARAGLILAVKSKASSLHVGRFYLYLGQALSGKKSWDAAIKILEKCIEHLGRTTEVLNVLALTLLRIGQVDKAEMICAELHSEIGDQSQILELQGYLHILREQYPEALLKLQQAVTLEETAFAVHLIALVLWKTNQYTKSFKVFIKAAKVDPYFSRNYVYLGHYYMIHVKDIRKAHQCYQKAFELDNSDEEAGKSLCRILKMLGEEDANYAVLRTVTEQATSGSCKWAWTQLGLCQMEKNDASAAVLSLQNAVRADPLNSHSWECLGDAYLKRGSYESALKAFNKASEINPTTLYPLYQISTIQKMCGLYYEAVEKYKNVLTLDSTYVPALIGLAETLLLLAKKSLNECLFGRAKSCCQDTLEILTRVATTNPGLSCLWKLAGDACSIPFHLSPEWYPFTMPGQLNFVSQACESSLCQKEELLTLGARFYGQALSIKSDVSGLWHDLGINYHFQSLICDPNQTKETIEKALLCLQKAVSMCPTEHSHWNALGVIALSKEIQDYALAQHAFIKSIQVERNNAGAWTNLGLLYLINENIELAHEAFKVAQSLEPTYQLCWIGQAMIAELVKHNETMDLYRHSTTLGPHPEALLGYGRWVCNTLLDANSRNSDVFKYNIEQMDAVIVATDCLVKYTANNINSPEAFNMLGMLLERQGLVSGSLKAYKRALDLIENSGKHEEVEKIRTNYARILSLNGQCDQAIQQYLLLKKVDINLLCSFGLTLNKAEQFQQAFKVFKQAFQTSQNPEEKSHILVAMAMVASNLKGPDAPNALSLLFESSQLQPPSPLGLLALCSIGQLQNEMSLAKAALKELHPFSTHTDHGPAVAFLAASCLYIQGDLKSARNQLLKAIHCHPSNSSMWIQLGTCLLQWMPEYAEVAATSSQIALCHGGNKELCSQIFALCQLSAGYKITALRAAQKAVHIHPDKLNNWITLAAACHVTSRDRQYIGWLFTFVKKLAKQQGIKSDLLGWLVAMEVFQYIISKDLAAARVIVTSALPVITSPDIKPLLQILEALINVFENNGQLDALLIAMKKNPGNFLGWQSLVHLLIKSEKFVEAEKTLRQFYHASSKFFPKWQAFPLIQLVTLAFQALKTSGANKDKWLSIGQEAVGEAVKIAPSSNSARFMQAVLAIEAENISLARRNLEKVISAHSIKEDKWMEKIARQLLLHIYLKKKDEDSVKRVLNQFPDDQELQTFGRNHLDLEE